MSVTNPFSTPLCEAEAEAEAEAGAGAGVGRAAFLPAAGSMLEPAKRGR